MKVVIFQAVKHLIVGGLATLLDLAIFTVLFWLNPLVSKSISFLIATVVKYWGNKHWAFQKPEKEDMLNEVAQFFLVTAVGLAIDVSAFYFFSLYFWAPLSVFFAAAIAAVWNFTAYKFLVFKR